MSVLVDTARFPAHGRMWAHLASDTSLAELHSFAARLGVPAGAFEGDHYDVPADLVPEAVRLGARQVTTREVLRALQRNGLRTPKRRGEKVLATATTDGQRVDVVRAGDVPTPWGEHVLLSLEGGVPVASPTRDLAAGRVLGFRRLWDRTGDLTTVRHDGVVAGPELLAAEPRGPFGPWWGVLLSTELRRRS